MAGPCYELPPLQLLPGRLIGLLLLLLLLLPAGLAGLTENQLRYLETCSNQKRSLPCHPSNMDTFVRAALTNNLSIQHLLSKAYFPGACYEEKQKYCPTKLFTCLSQHNFGYNYTVTGICIGKTLPCGPPEWEEKCSQLSCPAHQYLCHPQGCIPLNSQCNHHCPLSQPQLSTPQKFKGGNSAEASFSEDFNLTTGEGPRIHLCGHFCLDRNEMKDKYHCGDQCQKKSEPCRAIGEDICPQHFRLCGADTCIDRFAESRVESETGYPEYFSCRGVCTHASSPCLENTTLHCQNGYWLCWDRKQCILEAELGGGGLLLFAKLCDGYMDCRDGSDEFMYECFMVYFVEICLVLLFLILLAPLLIFGTFYYRGVLSRWLCSLFGRDVPGKSYQGNEDEMNLRAVAPEDVD